MGEKILYIEIFQPFAQYRNPFTFYYAQTYPLPPKSTIIGMLQNATNSFYDEKFWEIKVSIHGGFESVFWNYQRLIKATNTGISLVKYKGKLSLYNQYLPLYGQPVTSQRSPVKQQELFNGHLFLFLKGEDGLIDEIEKALRKPGKVLYLGRSEDVIFIKEMKEVKPEQKKKVNFFHLKFPMYILYEDFPIDKEKFPVYSICVKVLFKNNRQVVKNKAQISKETERETEFQTVIYTGSEYLILLKERIEICYFEINGNTFKIPEGFGWL